MYTKGQVVFSKSGRDKTMPFIVTDVDGDYVYLADGRLRKLEKPKKKKKMHIQITKYVDEDIAKKLQNGEYLNDAAIRKALEAYANRL